MTFGLSGVVATFQREINRILQAHRNYALPYIDDVIIFSDSWEEHCDQGRVREVIDELKDRNFMIRLGKEKG